MRSLLVGLALLGAGAAQAQGFATYDLSSIAPQAQAALGGGFAYRATPERVTLHCPTCAGAPMIDILLGRQDDGTEERVRSGETPISRMEALCRAKNPECRITVLKVAPAVGWISRYQLATTMAGSTAIILNGGSMLTIRSIAGDGATARRNAETLVGAVVPSVVGR